MTIPIPASMETTRVVWNIGRTLPDTTGTVTDLAGARGIVRFEPTAVAVNYPDKTILPTPVDTKVVNGVMAQVYLPRNDPDLWNWRVTPMVGVKWDPFHIDLTGSNLNLAAAAVVPGKGPIRAVTGPVGPANSLTVGTVTGGEEASATITGDAPDQSLSLVLPRGPQGIQGDRGPRGVEGEQGLPGVNAVPADEAVAGYVTSTSQTQSALDTGYRRGVSVREYGATGDGVTDDTAAFTAALATGRTVYVPEGDYVVSGATAAGTVDLVLEAGAVIHHLGGGSAIHVTGSESTPVPVTADVAVGARTVTAPGHGVQAGGWVRVGSDRLYDASSTSIRHGELVQVTSVDGDVLTLATPVQGGPYTVTDGAVVSRLDLVDGVTVRGAGTIRGAYTPDLNQTGLRVTLARKVHVSGISTEGIDYRHIAPEDTIDTVITGTSHEWAHSSGMGYGIAVTNAAQDTLVTGVSFRDVRHAFTTSNQAAVRGIIRRATVRDCTVRYSAPATGGSPGDALDTHTASEDVTFEGNTIIGASGLGINMEGRSGRIIRNTIIRPGGGGISWHNESDQPGTVEIVGNLIVHSGHYAINVSPPTRGSTAVNRGIIVSGNVVKDNPINPILIGRSAGTTLHAVTIQGNVSINSGTSRMITVDNASVVNAAGNVSDSSAAAVIIDDRNPAPGDDPGFTIRTIASGAVAVTPGTRYLRLGSTTGDELRNITGGSRGQIISVRLASGSAVVPITTGSGSNIGLTAAMTLTGSSDTVTLGFTGSSWIEVSRAKF